MSYPPHMSAYIFFQIFKTCYTLCIDYIYFPWSQPKQKKREKSSLETLPRVKFLIFIFCPNLDHIPWFKVESGVPAQAYSKSQPYPKWPSTSILNLESSACPIWNWALSKNGGATSYEVILPWFKVTKYCDSELKFCCLHKLKFWKYSFGGSTSMFKLEPYPR